MDEAASTTTGHTLQPIDTPEGILEAMKRFEALKKTLLTEQDYHLIQDRPLIKRSGWRKLALAFSVSVTLTAEDHERLVQDKREVLVWHVRARATTPSGRCFEDVGSCASNERRMAHPEHDTHAIAATRAMNRAVSNLVGGGELSAEELDAGAMPVDRRTLLQVVELCGEAGVVTERVATHYNVVDLEGLSQAQAEEAIVTLRRRIAAAASKGEHA